jgi:uncharacterized protein (DUF305 family)
MSCVIVMTIVALVLSIGTFAAGPWSTGALAAAECPAAGSPVASPDARATAESDRDPPADDLAILDAMLQQHARAMALANEGLKYAQDSQVRRMALRISEGHAGEIQLLRSWRLAWFPDATAAVPLPSEVWVPGSLGTSCSGEEFDQEFLTLLRVGLEAEVAEARRAAALAAHPELRDFAASLVDIRLGEISTIDSLLSN